MIDIIFQNVFLIKIVITIRILKNKLQFSLERKLLSREKNYQKISYEKFKKKFPILYEKIKKYSIDEFITPLWKNSNKKMEKVLLPFPRFDFLCNPELMYMMFTSSGGELMKTEVNFLENKIRKGDLGKIIKEEYFGSALISNDKYLSSHNSILHFYHLLKYEEKTGNRLSEMESVIEWGGGYGNLARIFKRYTNKKATYIIIDTPLFSCLQWLYLSVILGENEVVIISSPNEKIVKNKINIFPLGLLKYFRLDCDLFISTWALSESTKLSHLLVKKKNFFGARHLLMSFQESCYYLPDASHVRSILPKETRIEKIELMRNNFYAFV